MADGKVTVVLADDHHLVRSGVRAFLEREGNFAVLGETGDGLEVVALVERLEPAVLLLDLVMPGLNGLEVTRQVSQRCPKTRIVVLSMHGTEAYVLEALRNGAAGYIVKDAHPDDFIRGLREVAEGRRYLSPPLSERAIEAYVERARTGTLDLHETLSTREREVFRLVAEGYSTNQIAMRLCVSPRTIETHRANLMRKLGLRSHVHLIRYALQRGLLSMGEGPAGGERTVRPVSDSAARPPSSQSAP